MELRFRRRSAVAVTVALATALSIAPARAEPLPDSNARLLGLGRVWAKVKFYHPYLAYKDIDWDAALVAAIPKVEAATTLAEYQAAVQGMLAVLRDPVTRTLPVAPGTAAPASPPPSSLTTTPSSGVLEVKVAGFTAGVFDLNAMRTKGAQVAAEAAKAKAKVMIVDMRGADLGATGWAIEQLVSAFPAIDTWPLERTIQHHGFRTQSGQTSGDYFSTFITKGSRPPKPAPTVGVSHVVFVVDTESLLPKAALALQSAGRASIVAHGALDEASVTTHTHVMLPGNLIVQVRLGELLWGPPVADVTVTNKADLDTRAHRLAKTLATSTPKAKPRKLLPLPPLRARDDLDYADQPYPSRERRLLAGIRLWAVLDNLFPYRYLITDWDAALTDALPLLAAAPDRTAYLRVLRRLGVRAGDGHINVWSSAPDPSAKPRGLPPVLTRLVENKLVVTRILDAAQATTAGLRLGDIVETIDGKPVTTALADARPTTSGSTDDARDQRIAAALLVGDDGTTARLEVRNADRTLRTITVARTKANLAATWAPSTAPHWKKLPGNIGYVDLATLDVPEVDPMFTDLAGTRAIIFDIRGYPNTTAWAIAPRINTKRAKHGARFLTPLGVGDGDALEQRIQFLQPIPELPEGAPLYTGKIVVLVDDRAISRAEHTCLFFEAVAGATFIGSPTHGANGDVTTLRLPGGALMSFTGQEVQHADGRQLQRVGIQPHVAVRPTIAGVRAGKDEVLDRALAWIATQK